MTTHKKSSPNQIMVEPVNVISNKDAAHPDARTHYTHIPHIYPHLNLPICPVSMKIDTGQKDHSCYQCNKSFKASCKGLHPFEQGSSSEHIDESVPECQEIKIENIQQAVIQCTTDLVQSNDGLIDHSQEGGFSQEGTQELQSTTDLGSRKHSQGVVTSLLKKELKNHDLGGASLKRKQIMRKNSLING